MSVRASFRFSLQFTTFSFIRDFIPLFLRSQSFRKESCHYLNEMTRKGNACNWPPTPAHLVVDSRWPCLYLPIILLFEVTRPETNAQYLGILLTPTFFFWWRKSLYAILTLDKALGTHTHTLHSPHTCPNTAPTPTHVLNLHTERERMMLHTLQAKNSGPLSMSLKKTLKWDIFNFFKEKIRFQ